MQDFDQILQENYPTISHYIQNHPIKASKHVKYLSVTTDEHLSFNEHVNRIACKANTVKAFLQKNIKSCPQLQVKKNCYKIMVRPIMEYTRTVWSSYTERISKYVLEAVQRRAARFVNNDYSNFSSVRL